MKELIEFIAASLVDDPTQVRVSQEQRGGKVYLKLKVAKEDMGRVIGRQGRVGNGIRLLMDVFTDFPERLQPGIFLYIGQDAVQLRLIKCRRHGKGLLMTFEGLTSPED